MDVQIDEGPPSPVLYGVLVTINFDVALVGFKR